MTRRLATTPAQIVPLPDDMDAETGAMLEPLGVCIHALDLARPQYWESVAVLGCGPIGLGIVELCRLAGVAQLYAVDLVRHRREAAPGFGASAVADQHEAIADLTGGRGCDLVIEATNSPDGFQHATEAVRIGGRLVIVGIPDGDSYHLEAALARRKGLTVRFSRRMGDVYPRAVRLAAEGRVRPDRLITHRIGLDGIPDAFARLASCQDDVIKVMVRP